MKEDHKGNGQVIIKSICRRNNRTKFRKWMTRGEFVHFRSTIDTSRGRTRRIQLIIFNFIEKVFLFQLSKKRCSEASRFKVGSSLSFSNLELSEIISSKRYYKVFIKRFYLTFGFLEFKVVKKWTVNLFKGSEDFGFSNFIWLDWKV